MQLCPVFPKSPVNVLHFHNLKNKKKHAPHVFVCLAWFFFGTPQGMWIPQPYIKT